MSAEVRPCVYALWVHGCVSECVCVCFFASPPPVRHLQGFLSQMFPFSTAKKEKNTYNQSPDHLRFHDTMLQWITVVILTCAPKENKKKKELHSIMNLYERKQYVKKKINLLEFVFCICLFKNI